MRIEKLVYREYRHGKELPVNTIILHLDNGTEITCQNFRYINGKLEIFVYKPFGKWKRELTRNKYTKIMYEYFCKGKKSTTTVNCTELMKHKRAPKKGGGGKISPTYIVTDYECSNNPLHDFRRSMYVQWN